MLVFPNSKINIGLNILSKRDDGFHNIESVLFPIKLCDALEVVPVDDKIYRDNSFNNTGLFVDANPGDNLVQKVYSLLSGEFSLPSINIHLHKVIPFGAGLGGGSSDASYMLKVLNEEYRLGLNIEQLIDYASKIGSDCPFFINNLPSLATGRGEELQNVFLNLSGLHLVLVVPNIKIGTAEAYSNVIPSTPEFSLSQLIELPVSKWKGKINNDFEESVFIRYPRIAEIKRTLYDKGAVYASLSGSGAAVYGLFYDKPEFIKEINDCFIYEEKL